LEPLPIEAIACWSQRRTNTFASAVIEGKKDPGDESSAGIAAVTVDGNIAERSAICCARHLIC